MSRLQFDVELAADEDPKNNIIIIKSITEENGITYLIPPCFQAAKHHLQLLKLPEFLKIKKSLQRRGQNRKVWMSVPSDVLALYEDDVGNMTFNDYLLQEITQVTSQSITDGKLLEILEKLRLPTYITSKLDRQEVTDPILLFSALRMYENHNKNVHKHFAEKKSSSKSEVEFKKKNTLSNMLQDGKEKQISL
ncbi:hypothetical protein WA026_023479 [Henosepilachna vigintioctopunctata]|uniref:Uncharacterized protein n=1 Tax=Henosepilachna vigintioctopunctata TaxID=420089 RepID=A0AAW1V613_9CUCU